MKNINPHNLCTLNEQSDCAGCGIQGKLACKWDKSILSSFHKKNDVMRNAWEEAGWKVG